MRFVKIQTNEVFTKQEIVIADNISIPAHINDLSHLGYSVLVENPPTYDADNYNLIEGEVSLVNNIYTLNYSIEEKTQEEKNIIQKRRVPTSIAMWQARDVMIKYGILDAVISFIDNIADLVERKRAHSKFEFSNTVRRDDPLLNFVAGQAGYSNDQIDDWFIEGARL